MKTFKLIDVLISSLLITGTLLLILFRGDDILFHACFIVGGWQLISMIVHAANGWFLATGSVRRLYHRIILWMIVVFFALLLAGFTIWGDPGYYVLVFLYLLAVFTPVMAIFYMSLCFIEWKESHGKPMAKLNN